MARIDRPKDPPKSVPVVGAELYKNLLLNTACDMVRIEGEDVPATVPQAFIIRSLLELGRVAFIPGTSSASGWYRAKPVGGKSRYGFYKKLWCGTADDMRGFYASASRAKEIRANATATPLACLFYTWAEQLTACDSAIMANIEANRYSRFIGVPDDMVNSVKIAMAEGRDGAPVVVKNSLLAAFQNSDISIPNTAQANAAVRQFLWSNALRQIGGMCAEQARQERTQTAEVNAGIGESIDHIYTMIDQFNDDCDFHKVRAVMRFNGYAARYDEDPQTPAPKDPDGIEGAAQTQEGGGDSGQTA